eukprot:Hpha_TRINITY_DN13475_c0_g3::TRINITY_DN13475_c0_g3_i1::g.131361::m.131361
MGQSVDDEMAALLAEPLEEVLTAHPRFYSCFVSVDASRQRRLRRLWKPEHAAKLRPILEQCITRGMFSRYGGDASSRISMPDFASAAGSDLTDRSDLTERSEARLKASLGVLEECLSRTTGVIEQQGRQMAALEGRLAALQQQVVVPAPPLVLCPSCGLNAFSSPFCTATGAPHITPQVMHHPIPHPRVAPAHHVAPGVPSAVPHGAHTVNGASPWQPSNQHLPPMPPQFPRQAFGTPGRPTTQPPNGVKRDTPLAQVIAMAAVLAAEVASNRIVSSPLALPPVEANGAASAAPAPTSPLQPPASPPHVGAAPAAPPPASPNGAGAAAPPPRPAQHAVLPAGKPARARIVASAALLVAAVAYVSRPPGGARGVKTPQPKPPTSAPVKPAAPRTQQQPRRPSGRGTTTTQARPGQAPKRPSLKASPQAPRR